MPTRPSPSHGGRRQQSSRPHGQVVKTLSPPQPGTIKLHRRYGDTLVCVRYREDPVRLCRITTVELIVDEWTMVQRPPDKMVRVRLEYDEEDLRRRARALGAKWLPDQRLWAMPRSVARRLKLTSRITPD